MKQEKTQVEETVSNEVKNEEYKYKSKLPKPKLEFPTAKSGEKVDLRYFSNMLKNEKTRKFYFHLINSFCNKQLVEEKEVNEQNTKCSILNLPINGIAVVSKISDVVLAKSVYDVLYRHIMSQCFANKSVKFIVQETKRVLLINKIADYLDIPSSELNYDVLENYTSQACKKVEQMLHLHDRSGLNRNYKNGRVKSAFDILLKGPIPIKEDEVVRLEHPLIFDKYVPWPEFKSKKQKGTTLGDLFSEDMKEKLKHK